jgi:hypothetical protein
MAMYGLLLLLALCAWFAIAGDRYIQKRRRAKTTSARQKNQMFRDWAQASFAGNSGFQRWLAELTDEAIEALLAKLAAFCFDLGFQIDWLLEGKIAQDAALASRLQTLASQYVEACYEASQLQDDIGVFEAWRDYREHPFGKKQQALAQRLLTQLIDDGVSPAAAQSLLTRPEKERGIWVDSAVREAASKNPPGFRSALKHVLAAPVNAEAANAPTNN